MKLQDLVTDYLALRIVRAPTETTYRYYVRRLSVHTGIAHVEDCCLPEVIAFRDKLLETSCGVTWNSARRHLIALWTHAQSKGLVDRNPWREVQPARVFAKPKTIPDCDFERAHRFMEDHPERFNPFRFWRCVYWTLAFTGMRRAQLVGLIWGDIDFAKGTIRLRSETSKTHREYTIPLCAPLSSYLIQLHADAKALWDNAPEFQRSQVFNLGLHKLRKTPNAKPLVQDQVSRFFTKLARMSGASLSCHRMRHRLATRLLESDATHARNVQALLGHANVTTTLQYVSPNLTDMRRALEKLRETESPRS